METEAGAGEAGYPPEHSYDAAGTSGADGATTKNGKHPRREYDKVASEASERGQFSGGPATEEDVHAATTHSAGQTWEEGGGRKTPQCVAARDPDNRKTEERGPPEQSPAPNVSGRRGG